NRHVEPSPAHAEPRNWFEVAGVARELVSSVPGRVIAIEYEVNESRMWASHVGYCDFMRGWLQHIGTSSPPRPGSPSDVVRSATIFRSASVGSRPISTPSVGPIVR